MIIDRIALILAVIGGLNWGLVGLFRFDLVAYLFGGQTATVSRIVYTLVGIAAVWCISLLFRERDAAVEVGSLRPGEWDVVVRDVFAAGQVPAPTRTVEFVRACCRALAPQGVYLANMTSVPREVAGAEVAVAREVFTSVLVVADPAVVRGRRRGNLVLVASPRPWDRSEREAVERAVRRLPLPVRTWDPTDRALPQPLPS